MGIGVRAFFVCLLLSWTAHAQNLETVDLQGKPQQLHVYGQRGGVPIIVTSGDGGWIHLGPQVAELLSGRGYFVVGFDARAYLSSFTSGASHLDARQVPSDYCALIEFASREGRSNPVLIGVSAGAALSVLAATDPAVKPLVSGVIGLGLPDQSELGWRWRDAVIYLTHRLPDEPLFSTASIVHLVAPVPLAAIHSTHDEFVPLDEVQRVMNAAREPKKLWTIEATNHRFSGNTDEFARRLEEAIQWVRQQTAP